MNSYTREKVIGGGTFGTVWLVRSPITQSWYVLKDISLNRMSETEKQRALNEVAILSKCRHDNIIKYKDSKINNQSGVLSILMEYADGGDLFDAIKNQKRTPFSENIVISWFTQICLALQYIHYNNILHRDLKCTNIFLTKNKIIKVGDFGIARVLRDSDDLATTNIGTPYYLSPEMCKQQPYNCKTDMWALGCVLFEMSALEHPFHATDFPHLVSSILKGRRRNLPSWSGPIVQELVEDLLQLDPIQRSSADEILAKPSLRPYLKCVTTSKLPSQIDSKKLHKKVLQKEFFKSASETNLSPENNKIGFTSTQKLHIQSSSPMPGQVDFTKPKTIGSPSRNGVKIQSRLDLTKDNQCRITLNTTYQVTSCAPNQEKLKSKVNIFLNNRGEQPLHRSKEVVSPSQTKPKQIELKKELPIQNCMQKKIKIQINDETMSSTTSSNSCMPQSPCKHSQCHQCMIDMLWKNRIRGCLQTPLNNEEYSELEIKLQSIFKEKFHITYHHLYYNWNNEKDLETASKSFTKFLSYEQMQNLPLMMQLVQLDMLRNTLVKGKNVP